MVCEQFEEVMKETTRKWLSAGISLSKDKSIIVACPDCEEGTLMIKDEPIMDRKGKVERWLICDKCGAWNTILGADAE